MDYACNENGYMDRALLSYAGLPRYSTYLSYIDSMSYDGGIRIYYSVNGNYISVTCFEGIIISILTPEEFQAILED